MWTHSYSYHVYVRKLPLDVVLSGLVKQSKREQDIHVRGYKGLSAIAHAVLVDSMEGVPNLVAPGTDVSSLLCLPF